MWAIDGPSMASWSFGTSHLICPSLLSVHHAWTPHLTISIATKLAQLHIRKPRDILHNTTWHLWLAIRTNKHIWHMNSTRKSKKPLNSYVIHSSHMDETKALLYLVSQNILGPWGITTHPIIGQRWLQAVEFFSMLKQLPPDYKSKCPRSPASCKLNSFLCSWWYALKD
jgi:hypothetical protein